MLEHFSLRGGHYTASRKPSRFLWSEPHSNPEAALQRERQLKRWTHRKKAALIQGDLALLKKL
jgi:putative endonuclease